MLCDEKKISKEWLANGMNDNELEALSNNVKRQERGKAPWATWESENSSFGRTLRLWTGYPDWLPLLVCSDHGVAFHGKIGLNEIENKYKVHLTWNAKKYKSLQTYPNIDPVHVQHPWVSYRKTHYADHHKKNRKGTVVYFPHSNPQSELVFDLERFIENLKNLPSKFHPVFLCLMSHDIKKGLHKALRKYGIPLVTAGNTNSQYFVDRFYEIAYGFRYAASVDLGSHVFYLLEAGVPVFLTGDPVKRVVKEDWAEYKEGDVLEEICYNEEQLSRINAVKAALSIASTVSDAVLPEQREIAEYYLGVHSETTSEDLNKILWKSLGANKKNTANLYIKTGWKKIRSVFKKLINLVFSNRGLANEF